MPREYCAFYRSTHDLTKRIAISIVVLVFWLVGQVHSQSYSGSSEELFNAVSRLNLQLGTGERSDSWRRYLQLNRLEAQAAKGEQADLATLLELSQIFSSTPEVSQFSPFNDVKIALDNQIKLLQAIANQTPQQLIQTANQRFRPISISTLDFLRSLADFDLDQLDRYYREELTTDQINEINERLNVQEIRNFIATIEFELAPEISEGKINLGIEQLQGELRRVVNALDALPFEIDEQPQFVDERARLQAKEKELNDQIRELTAQRNEIRRVDLPRKRRRVEYLRSLYQFEDRFEDIQKTFGDPFLATAKFSLLRFIRAYQYATEDNLEEDFLQRIERLKEDLRRLEDPQDRRAFGLVGNSIEWLENALQTPELVAAIRAKYSQPNAYLHVSGDFLNRVGSRPVNETRPICEEIKGRTVKGYVQTSGTVSFDFVDDPDQVHVSIRSLNQISSNTQVEQGPLKIFVQTRGQAEARRSLAVGTLGILAENPYAAANMDNQFCGTSSNCNLINRVAHKKFFEEKNDNDVRTASRARNELLERFGKETGQAVDDGRRSLVDARNRGWNRYAALPALYINSIDNRINLVGKRISQWNLGSPQFPKASTSHQDIELRVHDSLPSNYIEPLFRGKTYTNDELAELLKEIFQTEDNPLVAEGAESDEDSFSITFSNIRPIQFLFADDKLSIVVSAIRFTRERRRINAGLTISLTFKFVKEDEKLFLVREGKAELAYIEGQDVTPELVALRSLLDSKLNPADQEDVTKVELPDNLLPLDRIEAIQDRPAAKDLILSQFRIEDGWIYLGWNYQPPGSPAIEEDMPSIATRVRTRISDSPPTIRIADSLGQ